MLTLRLSRAPLRFAAAAMIGLGLASIAVTVADAKPGRSGSMGSRGDRTHSAPPPTATAPGTAAPMQRSMTPQAGPTAAAAGTATAAAATAARPNMMRNLLLGGLIGAGLASILGTGALASVLGFVLQTLLIAGLVYLAFVAFMAFRNRNNPAPATANAGPSPRAAQQQAMQRQAVGGMGGGALPPLNLVDADFQSFERLLGEVQSSYGRNDVDALGRYVTPEMLSYFAHELDDNRKRGVRNEVGGTKLLQGDLSEVWREAGSEYATVAMRYSLVDVTVEAATGKIVDGSRTPQEVTELWTFRRDPNAGPQGWELSAIQQTA
jgi:predicted lipid-binding transport protein (Tim44 family)